MLSSSRPSVEDTTNARSTPSCASAPAIVSRYPASDDADQLAPRSGRIRQGPEEVEDGADGQRAAHRDDVPGRAVMCGSEHEPEADLVQAAPDLLRVEVDPHAQRLEDVGRAGSPVAVRLPCLAIAQPAPAAMSAAVVETLNEGRPPPVPAVSTRSRRRRRDRRRELAHREGEPRDLLARLPLRAQADEQPAICASSASPAMITARTSDASCALRSRPDATASRAFVRTELMSRPARGSCAASSRPPGSARTRDGTGRPPPAARGGGCP